MTRPCRGSVDVKFTRERRRRTTLTVLRVLAQDGQTAAYSKAYSASLSLSSSTGDAAVTGVFGFTLFSIGTNWAER
jgi:hypothetical protein